MAPLWLSATLKNVRRARRKTPSDPHRALLYVERLEDRLVPTDVSAPPILQYFEGSYNTIEQQAAALQTFLEITKTIQEGDITGQSTGLAAKAILDQGLVDTDLQRTLSRLKAPTLLVWGSADPLMEEEVRQTLREALPQAQMLPTWPMTFAYSFSAPTATTTPGGSP